MKNNKIKKGIKNRFIVIGTEVPLSEVEIIKELLKLVKKQIEDEFFKFKKILKN